MLKTAIIKKTGGPEVFSIEETGLPPLGPTDVLIKHVAIGLNFVDTYQRSGFYPVPLPAVLGVEASGKIEEVGAAVKNFKVGDRVAYGTAPLGAYSEKRVLDEKFLVKLPDIITEYQAASIMVKGLTSYYLLHKTYKVTKGTSILYHAAAGGVGQVAVQWAKFLGANIIATVGSDEKAEIVKDLGADHVINYKTQDFKKRVLEITSGQGVDVVYDSVGKDTFFDSLECLKPMGMMVSFGQASGAVPPFDLLAAVGKKSLFFTRPSLFTYMAKPEDLQVAANELFRVIKNNIVKIGDLKTYSLDKISEAHKDLESRKTIGSSIIIP